LWNEESGVWFDYDTINNIQRPFFTPTNFAPLFTSCFDESKREMIAEKFLKYIERNELDKYPGGVPNTLMNTGEQWDFPNVWAPMQYLIIYGLENLKSKKTSELAYKWAERWVQSNYKGEFPFNKIKSWIHCR
jgi:alpha,alpha-trehalase